MEKETILPQQNEQLSELENIVCFKNDNSFYYQLGADEGLTVPHGRRSGLNKLPITSIYSYYNINSGKDTPVKLQQAKNERNFIQYLTTRHSQGFYIYTLNELLL